MKATQAEVTALVGARAQQRDAQTARFRLQELCQRLEVSYRDARYLCEKNWLPAGVAREPGRGNHRQLNCRQAIWLGIVLKLKACGVRTRMATRIAAFAEGIKTLARNLGWDFQFSPFDGALNPTHQWLMEVGDMRLIRFATDANRSKHGLDRMPWVDMDNRQIAKGAAPLVLIQIDLSALARRLHGRSD